MIQFIRYMRHIRFRERSQPGIRFTVLQIEKHIYIMWKLLVFLFYLLFYPRVRRCTKRFHRTKSRLSANKKLIEKPKCRQNDVSTMESILVYGGHDWMVVCRGGSDSLNHEEVNFENGSENFRCQSFDHQEDETRCMPAFPREYSTITVKAVSLYGCTSGAIRIILSRLMSYTGWQPCFSSHNAW